MITKKVADNIFKAFEALDARADKIERLKVETMDGHRLFNGLEVYTADDPFYPAVIFDAKKGFHMSQVKGRWPVDRRKRYKRDEYDKHLFVDQKLAFAAKIKKHDEVVLKGISIDLEADLEAHKKERQRLLNGWAEVLNKENTHGPRWSKL